MDDLTKMSDRDLLDNFALMWVHLGSGPNPVASENERALRAEIQRRIAENKPNIPADHIMFADGRVFGVVAALWTYDDGQVIVHIKPKAAEAARAKEGK